MKRWQFDWPVEFRLMRPTSADDVDLWYWRSSYIGLLKTSNASTCTCMRTLSVIRVVLAKLSDRSQYDGRRNSS